MNFELELIGILGGPPVRTRVWLCMGVRWPAVELAPYTEPDGPTLELMEEDMSLSQVPHSDETDARDWARPLSEGLYG
jgi:hypothetical protein